MNKRNIAFVWDNFGPLHIDRCNAVAREFGAGRSVFGIELFARSGAYDWTNPEAIEFDKITLFADGGWQSHRALTIGRAVIEAVIATGCGTAFLSHYDQLAMLYAAIRLRSMGISVFTMGCSKYDDAPRNFAREWVKRQYYRPYLGGIGSERRSTEYMRELGLPAGTVKGGYNTVDQSRIRSLAGPLHRTPTDYQKRPFLVVARLIWEKNYPSLLEAYASYRAQARKPRRLIIAGSGPLEAELKQLAEELALAAHVDWLGFVQTEQIATLMRDALCLCLPSVSETFGNVVPEALALDLPVLISTQCGAADCLAVDGLSALSFAPDDIAALTKAMLQIGSNEEVWLGLRQGARELAALGDTARFSDSVATLIAST